MVLVCLCACTAHAEEIAVIIVSSDARIDQELLDDTTESVQFAIKQSRGVKTIPKEKLVSLIKYQGPKQPGPCFFGEDLSRVKTRCVAKALQKTSVTYALIVQVIPFEGAHKLQTYTVHADPNKKNTLIVSRRSIVMSDIPAFISACEDAVTRRYDALVKVVEVRKLRQFEYLPRRHARRVMDPGEVPVPMAVVPVVSRKPYYTWTAVSTGILTAGFGVTALVFGIQSADAKSEITRCAEMPCPELQGETRDAFIEDGKHKTEMANIMLGIASGLAVTTVVFAVLSGMEDEAESIPSVTIMPLSDGAQIHMGLSF